MPQAVGTTGVKRPANYSNCPLKKRPIKYEQVEPDYSSDSSDHNGQRLIHHDSDSSEPENLSTKPEDLRLVNTEAKLSSSVSPASALQKLSKDVELGTRLKPSPQLMPISTRTDKVNQLLHSQILGNSSRNPHSGPLPHLNYGPAQSHHQYQLQHLQSSPSASTSSAPVRHLPIPPPPPLKVFSGNHLNGNGRPLEPISFNPQVAISNSNTNTSANGWSPSSGVPHYLPFNFLPPVSTNVLGHGRQHQHSHHQSQVPSHGHGHTANSFSPFVPAKLATASAYPFYHHHQFGVHQHQHQHASQLAPHRNHLKGEIGSPPHVSPPLSNEPSYPAEEFTKFNLHHAHYSVEITPKEVTKREMCTREIQPRSLSLHKRERDGRDGLVINVKKSPKLTSSLLAHSHNEIVNRSRSLSSGSCSDRSSPIPDSSSLSPGSATGNSVSSTITPTNVNGLIRYQCPDCSKSYSTFSGLSKHLQFHCASQNKKSFICKFCDKVYVSLGALKMHIRTHTLPCKCTICGKAFSRPWLLQGHIRTHTGEKPFSCEFCHRAFADRSNLRAHLQTHSEVKKYSCQSCSKTFSRTSLLAKHKDSGCGHGSA